MVAPKSASSRPRVSLPLISYFVTLSDSSYADDRFIAKEISRLEMDALLRFAPAYFEYMSKAIFHGVSQVTLNSDLCC